MSRLLRGLVVLLALAVFGSARPAHADSDVSASRGKKAKKAKKQKKKVKVGGIMQVYYKKRFDQNDDGVEPSAFRVAKARVKVSGTINPRLTYQLEVDPRSPQLAGVMRDAYLGVHVIPGHEIRIGQQKTPWGYENMVSSQEMYVVTRTEIGEGAGRGFTLRDIGIGLRGKVPLGHGLKIEDAFAVVNGDGMSVQADHNTTKNVWGRVGLAYKHKPSDLKVKLGVSGGIGDMLENGGPPELPEYDIEFKRVGADLQIDHPWLFAVAEYARSRDVSPEVVGGAETTHGYYALIAGKTPIGAGPVLRYEHVADGRVWTIGGYWGEPKAEFRCIVHLEILRDGDGRRDDRLIAATQLAF